MKRKENLKSMEAVIGDAIADSGVQAVLLLVLAQADAGACGPTAKRCLIHCTSPRNCIYPLSYNDILSQLQNSIFHSYTSFLFVKT